MTQNPNRVITLNHRAILNNFNKHKRRAICLEGSSRSGKTFGIMFALLDFCLQKSNVVVNVFRKKQETCKKTVIADMKVAVGIKRMWGKVAWKESDFAFVFENGSRIQFFGTSEVHKIQGLASNVAWLNEAVEISEAAHDQIDLRCTDYMIYDWNPSVTQHWLFERVLCGYTMEQLKAFPEGVLPLVKDKDGNVSGDTVYQHSTFRDNPFLQPKQVQIIEGYKALKNQFTWNVYGLGLRGRIEGAVYPGVAYHVGQWPDASACKIRCYAVDWGFIHNTVVLEVSLWNDFLMIRELCNEPGVLVATPPTDPTKKSVVKILQDNNVHPRARVWCDHADPKSIAMVRECGFNALPCIKGHISDGIREMQQHQIYIERNSVTTFGQFERYHYEKDASGNYYPEPEKVDDDAPDAARYAVMSEAGLRAVQRLPTHNQPRNPRVAK